MAFTKWGGGGALHALCYKHCVYLLYEGQGILCSSILQVNERGNLGTA